MLMMLPYLRTVPGKLLNVRVTHIGSDSLSISWDPRHDVTLYEVRHWKLGDVTRTFVNMTSSSNWTLVRLVPDTQYSFQVYSMYRYEFGISMFFARRLNW